MKACCGAKHSTNLPLAPSTKLEMRRTVEALARAGRHLEACEILETLVAGSPRNPLIWNDLGIQYEAAGQTDKALTALHRGYDADSTYSPILYNLGKLTLDRFIKLRSAGKLPVEEAQGLLDDAIVFLNADLDRDPDNTDAHYNLAIAYALRQDELRAQAHMAVALRMNRKLEAPSGWRSELYALKVAR